MTEERKINPLTVPSDDYNAWAGEWKKAHAVVSGDAAVKRYDDTADDKILAPLSLNMDPQLYRYYKQRGELPGYASSQRRSVVGGLLRKKVGITLPEGFDKAEEARDWISNNLHIGGGTFMSLMKDAFEDDLITANTWLHLDFNSETKQPVVEVLPAESVISVTVGQHSKYGFGNITRVVVRKQETESDNTTYFRYQVHEINDAGEYQVSVYRDGEDDLISETEEPIIPKQVVDGKEVAFTEILVFPVDGSPAIQNPFLGDFITREISHYNLLTAYNHLLIMSGSLTPIITGNVNSSDENDIKGNGLGSVWTLPEGTSIKILETPTGSLSSFAQAIDSTRTDLRNLGARQLMKDSRTSGVAAEIQNSPYSATLSSLSRTYSNTLRKVVAYAVNWKYKTNYPVNAFEIQLSNDLSRSAIGDNAVATVTAAYNAGQLPREVWLQVMKDNSIIPQDYDDEGFETKENTDDNANTN